MADEKVKLEIRQKQRDFVADSINSMRKSNFLTDLIVVCDGTEIPVHRTIVCAASPFFQNVFKSESKESLPGKLELPSINLQTAEIIFDFLYTGKIPNTVNDRDQLKALAEASNLLQLNILVNYFLQRLGEFISVSDFLEFWDLAKSYNNAELQQKVKMFIGQNFLQASSKPGFLNLPASQLLEIMQNTNLKMWKEDSILNVVMTWIHFNAEERNGELGRLLQLIDLKNVPEDRLKMCLDYAYYINNTSAISSLLAAQFSQGCFDILEPTLEENDEKKLLIFRNIKESSVLTTYNTRQRTFSDSVVLPCELKVHGEMAMVVCNDDVYFFGGEYGNADAYSRVYKYSLKGNVSVRLRDLPIGTSSSGAAELGKYIYIVGGTTKLKVCHKTVQRYDASNDSIRVVASTNSNHTWPFVLTFNDNLYAFGSFEEAESAVEKYDPVVDQWTLITNVPGVLEEFSGTLYENKLFVARSIDTTDNLEINIFDFSCKKWDVVYVKDGPISSCNMWAVNSRYILVLDVSGSLHMYDVIMGKLEETGKVVDKFMWKLMALVK